MKRILLIALAAVAVVGCKKTDMTGTDSYSGVVQFKATTTSLTRTTCDGIESSWEAGDKIGIYMDGDDNAYNIAYEASSDVEATAFTLVKGQEALQYPKSGTADFYAYYPYEEYLTDGKENEIDRDIYKADLTNQSDQGAIDFMVASATDKSASNDPISLEFKHMLSKVELIINTTETISSLDDLTITINGPSNIGEYSYKGGLIDLASNDLEPIEFKNIDLTTSDNNVTQVKAVAILHPDENISPKLTISLGNMMYSVDIAANQPDKTFETLQGMIHTLTMYIFDNTVMFTGSEIKAWEDGKTTTSADLAERIGDGTADNPFYVYDAEDMAKIGSCKEGTDYIKPGVGNKGCWTLAASYKLMNNIDLKGIEWTPIGYGYNNAFTGSFDGNGKIISGLKISSENNNKGLFGYIQGASALVKNLAVVGCDMTGGANTGGIVGGCLSGTIQDCYVSGSVTGIYNNNAAQSAVGGIVGFVSLNANILRCYNLASVSGNGSGGIVGYANKSNIINCYNRGDITAKEPKSITPESYRCGGGIAARIRGGNIVACYNTGKITGISSMGGILGSSIDENGYDPSIVGCFSTSDITKVVYLDKYSISHGAIIGYEEGVVSELTISSCFYMKSADFLGCGCYEVEGTPYDVATEYTVDDDTKTKAISESDEMADVVTTLNNTAKVYNNDAETYLHSCVWTLDPATGMPILDFTAQP